MAIPKFNNLDTMKDVREKTINPLVGEHNSLINALKPNTSDVVYAEDKITIDCRNAVNHFEGEGGIEIKPKDLPDGSCRIVIKNTGGGTSLWQKSGDSIETKGGNPVKLTGLSVDNSHCLLSVGKGGIKAVSGAGCSFSVSGAMELNGTAEDLGAFLRNLKEGVKSAESLLANHEIRIKALESAGGGGTGPTPPPPTTGGWAYNEGEDYWFTTGDGYGKLFLLGEFPEVPTKYKVVYEVLTDTAASKNTYKHTFYTPSGAGGAHGQVYGEAKRYEIEFTYCGLDDYGHNMGFWLERAHYLARPKVRIISVEVVLDLPLLPEGESVSSITLSGNATASGGLYSIPDSSSAIQLVNFNSPATLGPFHISFNANSESVGKRARIGFMSESGAFFGHELVIQEGLNEHLSDEGVQIGGSWPYQGSMPFGLSWEDEQPLTGLSDFEVIKVRVV